VRLVIVGRSDAGSQRRYSICGLPYLRSGEVAAPRSSRAASFELA
jgi:hypothetical protein